jgi:hypothetical protein
MTRPYWLLFFAERPSTPVLDRKRSLTRQVT